MRRFLSLSVVAGLLLLAVEVTCNAQEVREQALEPWASNTQPTDKPKRHIENITKGQHEYTLTHGGTMDGTNCRSPIGCGIAREGAIEQTWQSNRAVRMENVGDTNVINPWLSNGRNNFRNLDEIVASATTPGMTDAEKAMAIWFQQIQQRFHRAGDGKELGNPVKVYNVYGHNPCGCDANIMGGLWRRAGLKGAPVRIITHAIAQVSYDGDWHVMDGDLDCIFLLRDNKTLASDRQLARDHDLVKRTHTYGILLADRRAMDEGYAAMFVCEDKITGQRNCYVSNMNMTLRPGEALTWRWGHLNPPKYMWPRTQPNYPATVCNGLWEYRPDFTEETWEKGAATLENVRTTPEGLSAQPGKTGTIVWVMRCPYALVGGRLEVAGKGAIFAVSADGKTWQDVAGDDFDGFFPTNGRPHYQYHLRCQLNGDATLKSLTIVNDLQMALLGLPEMVVGRNKLVYTDESAGPRKVRITHDWVERSSTRPPKAPPKPIYPPDGGTSDGTDIVFKWTAPTDPDGDEIDDYQFELSPRADMKFPLSMSFYKLISRTRDKGKPQYTLPYTGLLTPDTRYHWHVRAKDDNGVWGPWSKTWSFTPKGPAHPVEVKITFDDKKGVGTLSWKPNSVGSKPVKYRVYGSDEKGFSVSDKPYPVLVGASKELKSPFPANFIAETATTQLAVLGPEVKLPTANKSYYRVVALDARGHRSGPSDYASAPRPTIYSTPVSQARVGAAYRYQVKSNRSLGDLRYHRGAKSFWDIEKPDFALTKGPDWLKMDAKTGVLSGTPTAPGKVEVIITATIDTQVRKLDLNALGWGQERVIATTTERVGRATQKFVIAVEK